ncbi:EamA/RhaT family transporter [Daejeonella sp. H1SJ63]|jgi:drug/metabolite transporter (DMT)-like permease|uniref:EamA/RhaT family transporter n=1 Tax=Daejeonella sp. H1SJ63 TaxID=3034145 RepID=UPI0023EAF1B7|nr:EamA/RhaT family transporter [Daejeonella sp. H1SJ63]
MIYILLSVCCSVFVSVLLKLAKRYEIDNKQAITWNYSIAALLTWLIYKPEIPEISALYVSLGVLLPSIFLVLALSVHYTGIVRTDIAQRLSLFIPVLASFILFSEIHSILKIIGILIAFAAIIFSIPWQKENKKARSSWLYPLIVFAGMGIIDILFKQIAKTTSIPFTSSLIIVFLLAFLVSISYLLYLYLRGRMKFSLINLICGWILGIANFGNILFYLKAHQALANSPSMVFSSMNIGVIILGSAVGVLIFKEKLSRLNYLGIVLALISITVLYFSN